MAWSARIAEMEALHSSRQRLLTSELERKANLQADVATQSQRRGVALLDLLQLRQQHADAALTLASSRDALADLPSTGDSSSDIDSLEQLYQSLKQQAEAMDAAQRKERQMMSAFSGLVAEHVEASKAPLKTAQQFLQQAQRALEEQAREQPPTAALQARTRSLDEAAAKSAHEKAAATQRLVEVQEENRALQRLITAKRAATAAADAELRLKREKAANNTNEKVRMSRQRMAAAQQEGERLAAEDRSLDNQIAACRSQLLALSDCS